ncbi:MAG: RloB domain-containing protein [Candidatus Ornithospirochaeta sp.]|nr:RloB domain-containing protein [Candidatus Ornithospirochaeta sp.]
MKTRKRIPATPKKTLLLVCATEAEALYFSQMRKDCRYANLTVKAAEDKKSLESLILFAAKERNAGKYDSAWILFGFDDLSTNAEEVASFGVYAEKKKVRMCFFNPSFDLWFALHLASFSEFQPSIAGLKERVKSALPDYSLDADYFLTKGLNLHIRLFPRHASADINARNYNAIARKATGLEATTMPLLNADITEYCGQADMSHNQRARR